MSEKIIAPSILSADFSNLGRDILMIDQSAAQWIHIDVMDGVFVPNISFGLPVIQSIRNLSKKTFDVHLMIVQPERYVSAFKEAGADVLTVHYEASTHLHRSLQEIKKYGMKAGIAINPHTPVHLLQDGIEMADLICVMSVNPGFGGQSFIENTYDKVRQLKELILQKNSKALIEIDGGVSDQNATKLFTCGADVLVAGNYVFKHSDPKNQIVQLLSSASLKSKA